MSQQQHMAMDRRRMLQAMGGLASAAVLGGAMTGTGMAAHDDEYRGVRVNQVGYPLEGVKRAIITSQAMNVDGVSTFSLVDADSGETVYEGDLMDETLGEGESADNPWDGTDAVSDEFGTDHSIKYATFTEFDEPGEYQVVVGDEESYSFEIADASDLYAPVLRDVGRLYTLKRSSTRIEDPYTGLEMGPGHEQDEEAIIAEPIGDWLEDYEAGDTISITNGWYDAGDYGKYVNPTGVTVAQLMLAYERNPESFHAGQFHIDHLVDDPELGEMPDILVECKQGLHFLTQMQRPNGSLFYKLAGNESFPDMDVAPEDDDMDRYVFGTSSAGTAHACAVFAMAARIYEDHDPDFAQSMLEHAEDAWAWLEANPDLVWEESEDQDEGSGPYARDEYDEPDRFWAAAELLRTTGDDSYDQWIQDTDLGYDGFEGPVDDLPSDVEAPIDWNNPVGLGHYAYFWADGDLAGTSHEDTETAAAGLNGAYWATQRYLDDPDADEFDAWTTGVYDLYWGWSKSGLSRALQGLWAVEMHEEIGNEWIGDEPEAAVITEPLHHVLGRSPTGYSFVTGHGERSTQNPHDRIVQSQEMDEPIPGMLVGGPHLSDGVDEDGTFEHLGVDSTDAFDQGPLLAYADIHDSYATNEWAINYTAPLFMLLAEVVGTIDETPEPDPVESGDSIQVGEYSTEDTTSDGLHNDFTGDGETTHDDVTAFFENLEDENIQNNPEAFDFAGDGEVGFADIVEMLNRI
ncbi:hypothetical protein G6M89_18210 [Natronolimnobius sp. AArcel1]|uniref:glycoside hydrolase family 9 protein n=1 Tax=Natronolimnobius sp. AArcel1 TaxID=1679093 RepID=UPI0013EC1041|nr:glycoside hydrolase family 9 protein [Natronolimnobius sp. AArcel1]NGM70912.1 hypothetical protein [Natronolimnobius sp. AArcel1]